MKNNLKNIPLSVRILLGMLLGIIFGIVAVKYSLAQFTSDWIAPFGEIFVKLLKLIAIPLILVSLIKGVSDLKSTAGLTKMGLKTLGYYIGTTVIAVSLGIVLAESSDTPVCIRMPTRNDWPRGTITRAPTCHSCLGRVSGKA